MNQVKSFPIFLLVAILLASCASSAEFDRMTGKVRGSVVNARWDEASERLAAMESSYPDPALFDLDMGVVGFYARDDEAAIARLERAQSAMLANRVFSVTEGAASLIVNDNVKAYGGEGYEDMCASILKALAYQRLGMMEDALVEIRNADVKLRDYQRNVREQAGGLENLALALAGLGGVRLFGDQFRVEEGKDFAGSALASYVSMALWRESGKEDDARIDYERLRAIAPASDAYSEEDWRGASDPALVRFNVLSFDGLIVPKVERSMLAFDPGAPWADAPHKVAWPVIPEGRGTSIVRAELVVDGRRAAALGELESLTGLARDAVGVSSRSRFLGSYYRGLAKMKIAVESAKKAREEVGKNADSWFGGFADLGSCAADLALAAALAAVNESEIADTRMCVYLPDRISAGGVDLAPGTHDFSVVYTLRGGEVVVNEFPGVEVGEGRSNLLVSVCGK